MGPRARSRGPALPPVVPRGEMARAEAPLRARRPARRGRREHRQLWRGHVHRACRDRERRRSGRRLPGGARPDRRAPVELRAGGGRRPRRRGRRGDAARGDSGLRRRDLPAAREGRHALCDRGGHRRGRKARGVARRRARGAEERLRALRLGRRALRHPGAERPDSEQAALDRGAADCAWAPRRHRRRLRRDDPRRRQLRPRLGLDRVDGRCARGRPRQSPRREWVDDISSASKIDIEQAGKTMAAVAGEIFERDVQRHQERARALAALAAGEVPA